MSMKILSRDFTMVEKVLLTLLGVILVVLVYYRFVDQPVRTAINTAVSERETLQSELDVVNARVERLDRMESELNQIKTEGTASLMPSYNNSKEELRLLNDVLSVTTQYSISFADVTRDGDQIRRAFTLQFTCPNYATMEQVLSALANSPYRCLIGDITCSISNNKDLLNEVMVNATATFYETMVGGTPDSGLPADKSAEPKEDASSFDSLVAGSNAARLGQEYTS